MENSAIYDNFAYHIELLQDFLPKTDKAMDNTVPVNRSGRRASVWQMASLEKTTTGPADPEDTFNVGISIHGKLPSNTRLKGPGIARAQSCAINVYR
jgi:hypothetical protein